MDNALLDDFEDEYDPMVERILKQVEKSEQDRDRKLRHRHAVRRRIEELHDNRRMRHLFDNNY